MSSDPGLAGSDLVQERPPLGASLTDIGLQVMWNRLLSVVEEQAQTLVRTAFSTAAREAGDISAGVFDLEGRMLAQAVTGTPGHINSMARSVVHFLRDSRSRRCGRATTTSPTIPGRAPAISTISSVTSPAFHDGRHRRARSPARRMWSTSAASASRRKAGRSSTKGCSSRCCRLVRAGAWTRAC